MRKVFFLILIVLITLFLIVSANAFDGKRKGFILGFGIGPGLTSFTQEVAGRDYYQDWVIVKSDRSNKMAIMTDFKIGYAPTDFYEIYYTSKVSWFGITNVLGDNVTIANGLGALGATYYFTPQVPSPFISGGIGFSTWATPFESGSKTWTGFGLFAGVGYEFARHWSVEFDLLWGKPGTSEFGIDVSSNAFSVKATVNVLGY